MYINITSFRIYMSPKKNTSSGKGYTIDSRLWRLLNITKKTDHRGRVHVGDANYGKEIAVFVSDTNQELETCDRYFLLPYSLYTEVRKSRHKEEIGEPLKVQTSGDVYTAHKDKYVKIFAKVG